MDALTWGIELNAWLQTFSGPLPDRLFKAVTVLGSEEFYLVLIPLVYWSFDRRVGMRIALFFLFSACVSLGLKNLFASPRPFEVAPDRVRALVRTRSYGFPSAHAQGAATVWGYLAARLGGWFWIAGIGLPLMIGISRLYLGVHSPADVLGGWAVGAGCVALGIRGAPLAERWWAKTGLPVRLAGAIAVPLALATAYPSRLTFKVMAALAGTATGIVLERRFVRFSARGALWKRAVRFVPGAAALLALYVGFKLALPAEDRLGATVATVFSAARYCLAGLWVAFAGPLVFVKTGLAARDSRDHGPAPAERKGPGASRARTIRLRAIEDGDSGSVGAKALSLARMMRARLPVPPGFCVTGAACREHLDSGALADRTGVLFSKLGECEDSARPRVLAELRDAIVRAPLSEELTREIDRRYRELGAGHVAVRSSATAEDLPGSEDAGRRSGPSGRSGTANGTGSTTPASTWP
jgi:membrane-associated phospholipid phosphatase